MPVPYHGAGIPALLYSITTYGNYPRHHRRHGKLAQEQNGPHHHRRHCRLVHAEQVQGGFLIQMACTHRNCRGYIPKDVPPYPLLRDTHQQPAGNGSQNHSKLPHMSIAEQPAATVQQYALRSSPAR